MSADNMDHDEAISFLMADGDWEVPCCKWGRRTSDCAEIAWEMAKIFEEANGEPTSEILIDYLMGLVVNDHGDVENLIKEYRPKVYKNYV